MAMLKSVLVPLAVLSFVGLSTFTGAASASSHNSAADIARANALIQNQDYSGAAGVLEPLASAGDSRAQCLLGDLYALEKGGAVSGEAAAKLYNAAIFAKGADRADLTVPPWPHHPKDLQNLIERASGGDLVAKNELAFLYQNGLGVAKDSAAAEKLYKEAADCDDPEALNNLAVIYFSKSRDDHPLTEIVEMLKKSEAQGNLDAMANLGWLYEKGLGLPKDPALSLALTTKAAAHGIAAAEYNLGYFYQRGIGVERDLEKSEFLYLKAKLNNNIRPALYFGFMHEKLPRPKISSMHVKQRPAAKLSSILHSL
ncbi:MAG: sel1 repeat family protein [Cyanobacteria bacterium REEB67]|nr:sel1 repeat family protein [Cyanobacteria bacterium REEB67]